MFLYHIEMYVGISTQNIIMKGVLFMSFREWLYNRLVTDEYIDEEEWDEEDITYDNLLERTDLESYEIDSYKDDFREYCADIQAEPVMDVE